MDDRLLLRGIRCGKISYPSQELAQTALGEIRRRQSDLAWRGRLIVRRTFVRRTFVRRAYRCACGSWHLTSRR